MVEVILTVHLIVVLCLIGLVLVQRSEGGLGLGGGDPSSKLFTARGTSNLLSKSTAICAGVFFLTSLSLAYLTSRDSGGNAINSLIPDTVVQELLPTETEPGIPPVPGN